MKAVITVIGKDKVGILTKVSGMCADYNVNVEEVSQNILQGLFSMIMVVDLSDKTIKFSKLAKQLDILGEEIGVEIRLTRTELYEAMHRI